MRGGCVSQTGWYNRYRGKVEILFLLCFFCCKIYRMANYVEERDEGYWISGKRISLDSVVYAFRRGQSPESIRHSFPLLTLEEIYGAIAFYLANQTKVDAYLINDDVEFEKMRNASREDDAEWHDKMQKARQEMLTPQI